MHPPAFPAKFDARLGKGQFAEPTDRILFTRCNHVVIRLGLLQDQPLSNDNTSIKGQKAITVCMEMLQRGLIPISLTPICVSDLEMQIEGKDLLVIRSEMSVQVKCDAKCGGDSRNWPHWTGNLFLQKGERNIFGAY